MPTAQVFLSQAQAFLEGLFRTAIAAREDEGDRPPVCTKNLNPHIMMMKPAKDRVGIYGSDPLNWARDRRIFAQ